MKATGIFEIKSTLFLLCLGTLVSISAQTVEKTSEPRGRIFHAGFQAKALFQWTENDQAGFSDMGMRPGFAYGLNAEFGITPNVLLHSGVFHEFRSFGIQFADTSLASPKLSNSRYSAQYLQVPFGLTMKTGRIAGKWALMFRAGLTSHFLLSSGVNREEPPATGMESNASAYLNIAWVGIQGDAGLLYYFHENTAVSFQIGYGAGLSSIVSSNAFPFMVGDVWNYQGSSRLNTIHATLGILF
jgi:hypothetical protein